MCFYDVTMFKITVTFLRGQWVKPYLPRLLQLAKSLSLDPSIDCGGRTIANVIIDRQSLIHAGRTVSFELATRGGTLSRQNTAISRRISSFSGTNDDITTWKSSPHTGPLWGKPAWPVNSPHIGPIRWTRKIDGWSNAMSYVIQKKTWQVWV